MNGMRVVGAVSAALFAVSSFLIAEHAMDPSKPMPSGVYVIALGGLVIMIAVTEGVRRARERASARRAFDIARRAETPQP